MLARHVKVVIDSLEDTQASATTSACGCPIPVTSQHPCPSQVSSLRTFKITSLHSLTKLRFLQLSETPSNSTRVPFRPHSHGTRPISDWPKG